MKPVSLAKADARRLLTRHHFEPTTMPGVLERLGSIQYDPLKPVGCNHDLVLQARVPAYRVGDWEEAAYRHRLVYDAWDKQASLVRLKDWPVRRVYHLWHEGWWRERVFTAHPEAVTAVLDELRERGPLSSTAFEHQVHKPEWKGSWYGPRLTKHVLRALWHTGKVVTHHRDKGKHVYDLAERVIPPELLNAPGVPEAESVRWLLLLRHQAVGLLRPGASFEVWSLYVKAPERKARLEELVQQGELQPVEVDGVLFHAPPDVLKKLEDAPLEPAVRFLAPLDQLMWDRKAVAHLFGFDYIWEVYKPEKDRRWGYYVLPVMYGDQFIARLDARLEGSTWHVKGWWWEEGVMPDGAVLTALEQAALNFMLYLRAKKVSVARGVDKQVREVFKTAVKELA
jgi:uncharacterized protein YcaQ